MKQSTALGLGLAGLGLVLSSGCYAITANILDGIKPSEAAMAAKVLGLRNFNSGNASTVNVSLDGKTITGSYSERYFSYCGGS